MRYYDLPVSLRNVFPNTMKIQNNRTTLNVCPSVSPEPDIRTHAIRTRFCRNLGSAGRTSPTRCDDCKRSMWPRWTNPYIGNTSPLRCPKRERPFYSSTSSVGPVWRSTFLVWRWSQELYTTGHSANATKAKQKRIRRERAFDELIRRPRETQYFRWNVTTISRTRLRAKYKLVHAPSAIFVFSQTFYVSSLRACCRRSVLPPTPSCRPRDGTWLRRNAIRHSTRTDRPNNPWTARSNRAIRSADDSESISI